MANNRLFIYDPVSNKAVCIAKGYASGWSTHLKPYLNGWMNDNPEHNAPDETRYQLRTEYNMPDDVDITYEPDK